MTAGIDFACGDAVIVIDADLQHPPELMPEMYRYWREGYDVVYATRIKHDEETFFKRKTAQAFYWVIARLSNVRMPENAGDYRLMSRKAIEAIKQFQEALVGFFGKDPSASVDLSRIVNKAHFQRLCSLLDDPSTADKIVHGGERDEKTL